MAQLLVDKAVLEKELELVKKDVSVIPGQLSNKHKAEVVDALRGEFPLSMLLAATEKPAMDGSLVIHSDRGAHYRGSSWRSMTEKFGILRSMPKKGCSPDNAACEGFFGRIKNEMYYGRTWQNPQELKEAIATYIEFCNDHRIKISLDGLSIVEYRKVNVT